MGSKRGCIQHLLSSTSAQSLGLTLTPDQGVLAARKKTVGWHTPILAHNTWGCHTSTPRAWLPRPNPCLQRNMKSWGPKGLWVVKATAQPRTSLSLCGSVTAWDAGGCSGCKSGSQRPRQLGPSMPCLPCCFTRERGSLQP